MMIRLLMTALGALVNQKILLRQTLHEAARIVCGQLQVIEVVGEAVLARNVTSAQCAAVL